MATSPLSLHGLERFHHGVEPGWVVDPQHDVRPDGKDSAEPGSNAGRNRDDGIQSVVSSLQVQESGRDPLPPGKPGEAALAPALARCSVFATTAGRRRAASGKFQTFHRHGLTPVGRPARRAGTGGGAATFARCQDQAQPACTAGTASSASAAIAAGDASPANRKPAFFVTVLAFIGCRATRTP